MGERVVQLPLPCLHLGEGPYWIEDEQALLVVDMLTKTLIKHYVNTGRNRILHVDSDAIEMSMALPVEGEDVWVVGLGHTLSAVRWAASDPDIHTVKPMILQTTGEYQVNDAKCDPQGRLWTGTEPNMRVDENVVPEHYKACCLYKYDHNLDLTTCAKDVTLSNGLAWSNDKKHFYYVDTVPGCIYHFDYDDTKGTISGQRVLLDFEAAGLTGQLPDGMTIDQDDNLWVACLFGSQVACVDPRSQQVVRRVAVPAKYVTSMCWGGKDYATLYVTSAASLGTAEDQRAANSSAGGTFAITGLGTRGSPPVPFKPDLTKLRAKLGM